ncbi:MAG: hypothetical protein JWQ45_784 [Blastococcus sp.]|jgi:hypothetical protein|nr:hypothetical protein [Blastococcus sp.]
MRKSRLLLSGVAVAAVAAATSAFTNSNTFTTGMDNVAGYGQLTVTGVVVSNIAYTPSTTDATKLHSVEFTVDTDTRTMAAIMTLTLSGAAVSNSASSCSPTATTITCTLTQDVAFQAFNMTGLTVTSS